MKDGKRSTTAKTTGTLCDLCRTTITGTFRPTGLLRIGPGGKRLEREDYMAMKADAEQTRTMLHDIEARSEKIEETLTSAQGVGLQAQQMGVVMLQKAKQRAETIEANARAHAQIVKDEARRVHEENSAHRGPIRSNRVRKRLRQTLLTWSKLWCLRNHNRHGFR